jgi:hypothetical protein
LKKNNEQTDQEAYYEALVSGDIGKAMKDLVGNKPFEQWLEALKEQYLTRDTVSTDGYAAIRIEGERSMLLNIINTYKEVKNATLE